jgi:hypothetical protein
LDVKWTWRAEVAPKSIFSAREIGPKVRDVQRLQKMARAGIEPATPRFSGTRDLAAQPGKSPANSIITLDAVVAR